MPKKYEKLPHKSSLIKNIENFAKKIGFDLVGFSPAHLDSKYLDAYGKWLRQGFHADMTYMEKSEKHADLAKILPGAKSVIVLGLNYYYEQSPLKKGHSRIARYAYGHDYHKVIGKMLKKLEKYIEEVAHSYSLVTHSNSSARSCSPATSSTLPLATQAQVTRSYTDTGPILERAFAEQAGFGWIGKNSCLITREFGSWVFLGIVITILDLEIASLRHGNKPKNAVRVDPKNCHTAINNNSLELTLRGQKIPSILCGNCTRCIDACPGKAIVAPGVINANRCIAYHTIENKGRIPADIIKIIKKERRIFGCDICQEVCPHNIARQKPIKKTIKMPLIKPNPLFKKIAGDQLNLKALAKIISQEKLPETFAGSPLMRVKEKGLQRNIKITL